jgi:alpha-N-arabinofuranosidase
MVCLGIRPQGGKFHHLGRETFLAPVGWTENGWPVVNRNGTLELTMPAPRLPRHTWKEPPAKDNFDNAHLGLQWNFLRNPYEGDFSLTQRPGYLRLVGSAVTMNDQDSPAFVGRRQTHLNCRASTLLDFDPNSDNEEAGFVVRGNEKNHYEIGITLQQGKRQVFFRKVLKGEVVDSVRYEDICEGDVILSVEASELSYEFSYQSANNTSKNLGTAMTRDLSSEKIGGFTGVYFGIYATGNRKKCTTPVDFDWFEYLPAEEGL